MINNEIDRFFKTNKERIRINLGIKTNIELIHGNCLEKMDKIKNKSVDFILADPPYGATTCKWDSIIPFDPMWSHLNRIIKDNGVIAIFGNQPFSSYLVISNIKMFKYEYVWIKSKTSNFMHAKNMPLKFTENILIFSKGSIGHNKIENRMNYNPQGILKTNKQWQRPKKYESEHNLKRKSHELNRIIEFENYPTNVLKFGNSSNKERGLHPTQKPISLMEHLIKTYTKEEETVLDFCMGSGTVGVACKKLYRNFIGIEIDEKYFQIARERIKNVK